ncbi:MAG: 50S ribosomal protein L34e [Candidatus Micrarchaeota archaeon]|nr:50S ribosomal protein L34e [Candidatus Micrarchaeota archaeon]
MPKPMNRSSSFRRLDRVTKSNRHVIHFKRRKNSAAHCAICRTELNGISPGARYRGRSASSNARLFGGVLCAACTSRIIKLASRIEHGEMKLNDIRMTEKGYVLQMISH